MTLVACPSVLRASSGSVAVVLSGRATKNILGTSFVVGSDGFFFLGSFCSLFSSRCTSSEIEYSLLFAGDCTCIGLGVESVIGSLGYTHIWCCSTGVCAWCVVGVIVNTDSGFKSISARVG